MKIKRHNFYLLALFLWVGVFHLQAADSTNATAPIQESWQAISNRWSSAPLEKIKQAAETNDVTAQYYLANAYSDGLGISKDEVEAFEWMKLVAQQGMARAQRKLGWMLQKGLGVETNLNEAVVWYQKAARQNDAQAQMNLGWMYENGVGVPQDYAEAAKFYRSAADQGQAIAQNNLGWLYKNGWGVPDDQVEAVKWFQKSAEQGEHLAQKNLAWIYAAGEYGPSNTFGQGADAQIRSGGVAPNHELAEKWMRQALDLNSAEGQYQFGDLLYGEFDNEGHQDSTRFSDAAEWFRKSAEQGYAKAQYQLAEMYNAGQLGDNQRSNCVPWYLKAAAQGNAEAQAEVGKLPEYYPNSELLKSVDPVVTLLRSAESGNFDAQFQLAKRYQSGDGVPKDPAMAFSWMQKASQNGQTTSSVQGDALYCLALMYEKGEGVQQDLLQTTNLIVQAAQGFNQPDAEYMVGQMYEKGEGFPQDDYLAARSYFLAMTAFNGREFKYQATEQLLKLYTEGRGISKTTQEPDAYEDHELKNKSALLEYIQGMIKTAKAQFYAGEIYYQGKLVPKDIVAAATWFQLAASQNLDEARKMLDQIESEMSSAQKEAVQKKLNDLEQRIRYSH